MLPKIHLHNNFVVFPYILYRHIRIILIETKKWKGEKKMKKIGVFFLFLIVFVFFLAFTPVKAATIVDVEGGATESETSDEISDDSDDSDETVDDESSGFGNTSNQFYLDEDGTLHVGENVSEQHFFNHLFGKLLQGLNVAQIVAIIVIIFFAVIIVVLLIANIIGDKKKVGFYLFGLLACGLGVVFIYFAKDIFAAFVSWTAN